MDTAYSNTNVELIFVVALIAGISALAWLVMANPLRLYRTASMRFALANVLIVSVVICGALRQSPDSVLTLVAVGLVIVALSVYDMALRRLFRMDDSYTFHVMAIGAVLVAFILWFGTSLSLFFLAACLYAIASLVLIRTCVNKVRLVSDNTSSLAGWLLSAPDFMVSLMLAIKAFMLVSDPQTMWSFMVNESDNTLAIWGYIILTLTINVTAFASALSRIILRMKHLASHDQLTGLYNRRAINENLELHWQQYLKSGASMSILMLDVDHFKRINDQYGHQAGDQALKVVADHLLRTAGNARRAARFGGEEFLIVLPETDKREAMCLANQLCEQIQTERWHPQAGPMSVSIGCATAEQADSLDHLLSQADHALYEAKQSGRAQVKLFYSSSSVASSC